MDVKTPPFVLWLSIDGGKLVCFSFSDGSMSEPFSSVAEATAELLAAVENDKVTVLQAEMLESLIKVHQFSANGPMSPDFTPKPILVRDGEAEEDVETLFAGLSRYRNGYTIH